MHVVYLNVHPAELRRVGRRLIRRGTAFDWKSLRQYFEFFGGLAAQGEAHDEQNQAREDKRQGEILDRDVELVMLEDKAKQAAKEWDDLVDSKDSTAEQIMKACDHATESFSDYHRARRKHEQWIDCGRPVETGDPGPVVGDASDLEDMQRIVFEFARDKEKQLDAWNSWSSRVRDAMNDWQSEVDAYEKLKSSDGTPGELAAQTEVVDMLFREWSVMYDNVPSSGGVTSDERVPDDAD